MSIASTNVRPLPGGVIGRDHLEKWCCHMQAGAAFLAMGLQLFL
jgi:hypothetical protein